MSTRPQAPGKMIPYDSGPVPMSGDVIPSELVAGRTRDEAIPQRNFSTRLSRAAREDNPVQLGTCAHDGGTLSRLGLQRKPHSTRTSGEERADARRAKTRKGLRGPHFGDCPPGTVGIGHTSSRDAWRSRCHVPHEPVLQRSQLRMRRTAFGAIITSREGPERVGTTTLRSRPEMTRSHESRNG